MENQQQIQETLQEQVQEEVQVQNNYKKDKNRLLFIGVLLLLVIICFVISIG